jgi:hypothetical protein
VIRVPLSLSPCVCVCACAVEVFDARNDAEDYTIHCLRHYSLNFLHFTFVSQALPLLSSGSYTPTTSCELPIISMCGKYKSRDCVSFIWTSRYTRTFTYRRTRASARTLLVGRTCACVRAFLRITETFARISSC